MSDLRFNIGDKVMFSQSPFLQRNIGHLAWVQTAIENNEIFTVTATSDLLGDQFISFGNRGLDEMNAKLFTRAPRDRA